MFLVSQKKSLWSPFLEICSGWPLCFCEQTEQWLRGPTGVPGSKRVQSEPFSMCEVCTVSLSLQNRRVRSLRGAGPRWQCNSHHILSFQGSFNSYPLNFNTFVFCACPWKASSICPDACFIQEFLDRMKLSLAKGLSDWTFITSGD